MQTTVFCKTTAKGIQTYFVRVDGRAYFLFTQRFYKSNKEFFQKGVNVCALGAYSGAHSASVRRTLDKLPAFLRYIEKEYGVAIFRKSKEKSQKRQTEYKRDSFRWQNYEWEIA
ncbi:MAG: hypothetical protein HFE47_04605 [Clostridia bacterium]|nr:hypothetical protein [Clostridia bacterium]